MATISRDNLRWIPLALLALLLLFLGAAALGWAPFGSLSCRGMVVLFGSFLLSGALIRPAWFWNTRKARQARTLLGDRLYAALLIGFALVMIYKGVVGSALDKCTIGQ